MPTSATTNAAIAGGVSGAAQVICEQPLDTLKTRLQSTHRTFLPLRGALPVLTTTVRSEGWAALMQGLGPRLLTYSLVKTSLFAIYTRLFEATHSTALSGAGAGALNTIFSCPSDVIKTQLQMQRGTGYVGPWATVRGLVRRSPMQLYRGWLPLLARDTAGYAVLYTVFFECKQVLPAAWMCGGVSGVCFYLSTLPIDRVKTVLMTQPPHPTAAPSASESALDSTLRCFRQLHAEHGVRGFYRGSSVTLLRTFVGQTAALTTFDAVNSLLRDS